MTRHITAHKGGRTARAPQARVRPQTLDAIKAMMKKRYLSFADLLEEQYGQGENEMANDTTKKTEIKFAAAWVKRACADYGIKATWFRVLNYDTDAKGDLIEVGNTKRTKVLTSGDRAAYSI